MRDGKNFEYTEQVVLGACMHPHRFGRGHQVDTNNASKSITTLCKHQIWNLGDLFFFNAFERAAEVSAKQA